MYVPHVADDDVDAAAHDVCHEETDGRVGHVGGVAGAGLTEHHRGLNHQEYPSESQQEVQDLHGSTGFLQEDAGEQGDDGRLDGRDHHHVAYWEISEGRGEGGDHWVSLLT